jgi:hypothetical protein
VRCEPQRNYNQRALVYLGSMKLESDFDARPSVMAHLRGRVGMLKPERKGAKVILVLSTRCPWFYALNPPKISATGVNAALLLRDKPNSIDGVCR